MLEGAVLRHGAGCAVPFFMDGQIRGTHCREVFAELLASLPATPPARACQEEMQLLLDEDWCELEHVIRLSNQLKAVLPDAAFSAVGTRTAVRTLKDARARGARTPEEALGQLDALVHGTLRGFGSTRAVKMLDLKPGHVLLETPLRFPPALLLGALRGFVMGFDRAVTSESVMRTAQSTRLHVTWK